MAAGREARGYTVVGYTTATRHAAVGTHHGHSGLNFPRGLCAPSTSRFYAWVLEDQDSPVTCRRCLAALAKKGLVTR
jgi:hypothetical protein